MNETPKVYAAIVAVMADMAKEGISKDRKNQAQGYNFRGIDDVYNALSGVMSRHGLVMLPRCITRHEEERESAKGGRMGYVTVEAEFDLVCAADGSMHTIRTFGEAMDSADKATNKAMSAAYKYAAMQAFCIPTEGDNDADAYTPEVKPKQSPAPQTRPLSEDEKRMMKWLADIGMKRGDFDAFCAQHKNWAALALNAESEGVTTVEELRQYVAGGNK